MSNNLIEILDIGVWESILTDVKGDEESTAERFIDLSGKDHSVAGVT